MAKTKLYDLVKKVLEEQPITRASDKYLIVEVLWYFRVTLLDDILKKSVPSFETITRARRKIQQLHPELQTDNILVQKKRKNKMATKGTFIFRETV